MIHRLPFRAVGLLGSALLLMAACDDAVPVDDKDRRIALAAFPRNVCPDPGGTATSDLVATVFSKDGNTQEGITVFFETTSGTVEPAELVSDQRGLARTTLTVPRTPNLTVTARLKRRGKDTAELTAPGRTGVNFFPNRFNGVSIPIYSVGDTVEMRFILERACHAKTVRFVARFDPTYLAYVETVAGSGFGFSGLDEVEVEILDVIGPDTLEITAIQDPTGDLDFTGTGEVVIVKFEAIAETPTEPEELAEFELSGVSVQDGLNAFYDINVIQPPGVFIDPADEEPEEP